MKNIVFFMLVSCFFPTLSISAERIDCKNPIDMQQTRFCAEKSLDETYNSMQKEIKKISEELSEFIDEKFSKDFNGLQNRWIEFVEIQCAHKRKLYGKGSQAGISYITCKEHYYKSRINDLRILYKDVISMP